MRNSVNNSFDKEYDKLGRAQMNTKKLSHWVIIPIITIFLLAGCGEKVPGSMPADLWKFLNAYKTIMCSHTGNSDCLPKIWIDSVQKATTLTDEDKAAGITEIWCINFAASGNDNVAWVFGKQDLYAKNDKASEVPWENYYPYPFDESTFTSRGCTNFNDDNSAATP
jgi:hypothetical protein